MDRAEQVISGFRDFFNKLVWLNKVKMEKTLSDYKASEVHCIDCIGGRADSNVTILAEALYMTSGAISKITKKLIKKGVIESYRKPDNRKELYFRLTRQGRAVYQLHEALHREFQERDKAVFERITDEQLDDMLRFAEAYSRHLDAEIKKLGAEAK
jgi:DNA-binding MarR family transcriptional regulator